MKASRHRYDWSKEEDLYVKENYLTLDDGQMALHLKRTQYAVQQRRYRLFCLRKTTRIKLIETLHIANVERNKMISIHSKVTRMRELIQLAENEPNNYKKDKYKLELKKLSGL